MSNERPRVLRVEIRQERIWREDIELPEGWSILSLLSKVSLLHGRHKPEPDSVITYPATVIANLDYDLADFGSIKELEERWKELTEKTE